MEEKYRYSTVVRAVGTDRQRDSKTTGSDIHIKPGNHPGGHECSVTSPAYDGQMTFETVAVYKSTEPMDMQQAIRMARDRYNADRAGATPTAPASD